MTAHHHLIGDIHGMGVSLGLVLAEIGGCAFSSPKE
jgi:hypothetical protein